MERHPSKRHFFPAHPDIPFLAIFLLAGILRFLYLDRNELWWDEYLTLHRASLPLADLIRSLNLQAASDVFADTSPPLHHILVHFSLMLGRNEFFARLPSALCGWASVGMLYFIGRDFFNRRIGLYASLFCALLQFHLVYSRDMRWYAPFYFFSLASLYYLYRMLKDRRLFLRFLFVVFSTAALYASYIGGTFLAGEGFSVLLLVAHRFRSGRRAEAKTLFFDYALCAALIILLYAPQFPGQMAAVKVFYTGHGHPLSFAPILLSLRTFMTLFQDTAFNCGYLALGLIAAGVFILARMRRRPGLALLLFWALTPTAAAFMVDMQAEIKPKYLVGLLFLLILTTAACVDFMATFLEKRVLRRQCPGNLGIAAGLCLTVLLSLPSLDYASFYNGNKPVARFWAGYLALHKDNVEYLAFDNNRHKKVILNWLLGDLYKSMGDVSDQRYKRFYYLTTQLAEAPAGLVQVERMKQEGETLEFYKGGVLNRAPVPLAPDQDGRALFHEEYADFSFYQNVLRADNVAPDFIGKTLALYSLDKPGSVEYLFRPPDGRALRSASLRLGAMLRNKQRNLIPDAIVKVFAGEDPQSLRLAGIIDFNAFRDRMPALADPASSGNHAAAFEFDLPVAPGQAALYVRLEFFPGAYQGHIDLRFMELRASLSGQAGPDEALRANLEHVARNTPLVRWIKGVSLLDSNAVHLFAADAAAEKDVPENTPCNSSSDLAEFRAGHPNFPPVMTLARPDGSPAYVFYDPALLAPGVRLRSGETRNIAWGGDVPARIQGVRLEGEIHRPGLTLGGASLDVPVGAPTGSAILLNPGGRSMIAFSPRFTEKKTTFLNMIEHDPALRKNTGEDCLSCATDKPCSFTYLFASDLPFDKARILVYPRTNAERPNFVRISYAANEPTRFTTLFDYSGTGPQPWVGALDGLDKYFDLPKSTHLLYLRFELSGDGAQLWSREAYPMTIEAEFDASALSPPVVSSPRFELREASGNKNDFAVWLDPDPLRFYEKFFR